MVDYSDEIFGLGTISPEVNNWLNWQQGQFMQLSVERLAEAEAREYTGDDAAEAGIYWRLSAPGYMDCTDWAGPFTSLGDAVRDAYRVHGEDMELPDGEGY